MQGERWRQVDKIFHDLIDQAPEQRASFLAQVCANDPSLKKEVEQLIEAYERSGNFLDSPVAAYGSLIGRSLGSYQVQGLLGAGGMGAVYRARDLKLKRDVAVKVLPEDFAGDVVRIERFRREAEILASVNHSNIAAIYDLQQHLGSSCLILEFVDGETLTEIIKRGPLPLKEALEIAGQIAEGLEAAHEKGIIHRDLKPGNVMVTRDRKVKILDFGVATTIDGFNTQPKPVDSTASGAILGTPAYMSPEQVKGEKANRTSDLWSFGCVLYEMLCGSRAFQGEVQTEILARVLETNPDLNKLPRATPPALLRLIRRCLEKDPRLRLHDAADARIELEESLNSVQNRSGIGGRRFSQVALALVAVATTAIAAVGLYGLLSNNTSKNVEQRFEITTPPTPSTPFASFAVAPDGQTMVFAAVVNGVEQLWLRSFDSDTAHPIPGTVGGSSPFWSPDSKNIGFSADKFLKRVDLLGGSPQTLYTNLVVGFGGAWNQDGTILFSPTPDFPLFRVSDKGGDAGPFTKLDPPRQSAHESPQFLPDGDHFIFHAVGTPDSQGEYVGSLHSKEVQRLVQTGAPALFFPPQYLLFIQQGTLFAQPIDLHKFALIGAPEQLARGVVGLSAGSDVIAYRLAGSVASPSLETWFDRSGKAIETVPNTELAPVLSPDGNQLAGHLRVQGNFEVWITDMARHITRPVTRNAGASDGFPIWSPDGKFVVYASLRNRATAGVRESTGIYLMPVSEIGNEKLVLDTKAAGFGAAMVLSWSSTGYLLFEAAGAGGMFSLYALPIKRDGTRAGDLVPVATGNFNQTLGQFSPDGHWIAYQSDETGRFEIYLQPFPGPGPKQLISRNGGTQVRWSHAGNEVFYVGPDTNLMSVPVAFPKNVSGPLIGAPGVIAPTLRVTDKISLRQGYNVSPDDSRFLMTAPPEPVPSSINVILHWKPKQRN